MLVSRHQPEHRSHRIVEAMPETCRAGVGQRTPRDIRDYALIGDCHGAALVARDGDIDWCCLSRFDADPVFARLLDIGCGGHLSVRPVEAHTADRAYLDATNILRTEFTTAGGRVAVIDFMPVGRKPGASTHDYVDLNAPGALVRIVEGVAGNTELRLEYAPMRDYAAQAPELRSAAGAIAADRMPTLHHDWGAVSVEGARAHGTITLRAGERRVLVLVADPAAIIPDLARQAQDWLRVTEAFWVEWAAYCRYRGEGKPAVLRSALALKLMTWAPSGAIVAAPTTSLPEWIGGARNWDYRYCWLRDAAFSLYALAAIGYSGEARRFSEFLPMACARTFPKLQIMYGIDGTPELPEVELGHLRGYRDSRPVRVGNGAYAQRQIDVYGEVLDWAATYRALGGSMPREMSGMVAAIADSAARHWREPDHGIWEARGAPRHYVHGKVMAWVALDRAIAMLGDNGRWGTERDALAREVLERGVDPERGCLTQAYGAPGMDAALLLVPLLGFPAPEKILHATIDAVCAELREGDFVRRYQTDDGLEGHEGAFLICSFWLVDALLWQGRGEEAEALLARLTAMRNDVGLLSEELDPATGEFLGNFPQAFTHLALIGSATHLDLFRRGGRDAFVGTYADRAKHAVGATMGWRGWWAAAKATQRVGRLLPSRRSVLRLAE
jgi:GH15 family glucan-1,4-alpha-glucosidase